jgi:hypothetical protein
VLVAVYWVADGVRGPIGSVATPLLPAFVSASSSSGGQYRTLVLRPAGASLTYTLVRQSDPTLGEPELTAASAAAAALDRQVAALGAPQGADAGDPGLVLGDFGIKWVMLPGPVNQALAQRLDASVGLVPVSKAPAYDLWQVSGPVARVRVVAKDGTVTPLAAQPVGMTAVSAPAAGGTLVLAEPYGGWTAMLGGTALKPLPAPVNGWAQGFTLPAGGGQLVITRNDLARNVSLLAELVAVLAICVLALPGKRADPAEEAAALAALRDAQHGRRAARAARGSRLAGRPGLPGLPGLPGRAGLSRLSGRLEHSGREAARTGRAAAERAGLGAFRGRATAQDTDPADLVTTGSGVGVLDDADADEPDYTEERDQAGQRDPWETGPQQAEPWETGPHPRMLPTGPQQAAPWETGPHPRMSPTGPQQAAPWETGPQQAEPWETGPHPRMSPTGPQPATGPWDTGGAGQPPDDAEGPGWDETAGWDEAPGADETPEWRDDPPRRDEPARPAERHSHRARRHGRPGRQGGRWGAGNQRGSDGGS